MYLGYHGSNESRQFPCTWRYLYHLVDTGKEHIFVFICAMLCSQPEPQQQLQETTRSCMTKLTLLQTSNNPISAHILTHKQWTPIDSGPGVHFLWRSLFYKTYRIRPHLGPYSIEIRGSIFYATPAWRLTSTQHPPNTHLSLTSTSL